MEGHRPWPPGADSALGLPSSLLLCRSRSIHPVSSSLQTGVGAGKRPASVFWVLQPRVQRPGPRGCSWPVTEPLTRPPGRHSGGPKAGWNSELVSFDPEKGLGTLWGPHNQGPGSVCCVANSICCLGQVNITLPASCPAGQRPPTPSPLSPTGVPYHPSTA